MMEEKNTPIEIIGISENSYLGVINFLLLIPNSGWILAIIAWAIGKEKSELVDKQGRHVICWIVSSALYNFILMALLANSFSFNVSGALNLFSSFNIGALASLLSIRMLPILALTIIGYVFPIMGALKGLKGETWRYPLALSFFKRKEI